LNRVGNVELSSCLPPNEREGEGAAVSRPSNGDGASVSVCISGYQQYIPNDTFLDWMLQGNWSGVTLLSLGW